MLNCIVDTIPQQDKETSRDVDSRYKFNLTWIYLTQQRQSKCMKNFLVRIIFTRKLESYMLSHITDMVARLIDLKVENVIWLHWKWVSNRSFLQPALTWWPHLLNTKSHTSISALSSDHPVPRLSIISGSVFRDKIIIHHRRQHHMILSKRRLFSLKLNSIWHWVFTLIMHVYL